MKFLIITLIFCSSLFAQNKADQVVATVNGKEIKKSTLIKYHTENLKFVQSAKKVTLQSSLNDLINRIIGVERARSNNLHKNPKVIKKMNDILYHAQISKDLEDKLLEIKVSEEEVKKYYKDNPEYRTAQILYRLPVNPKAEDVKNALKIQNDLYSELLENPSKFSEIAQRFSQANGAQIGGDLGYQPRTRLTPEYFNQINGKSKGYITKPFRSQYGFHIVKVLGVKDYSQIQKDMYKKIIYDTKRDKILESYFAGLRKKAKIKIDNKVLKSI